MSFEIVIMPAHRKYGTRPKDCNKEVLRETIFEVLSKLCRETVPISATNGWFGSGYIGRLVGCSPDTARIHLLTLLDQGRVELKEDRPFWFDSRSILLWRVQNA